MSIRHISDWVKSLSPQSHKEKFQDWLNICSEARPCVVASYYLNYTHTPRQFIVIVPTYEEAVQWNAKLHICGVPQDQIKILQNSLSSLYDDEPQEKEVLSERFGAMLDLFKKKDIIVIATPDAALEKTISVNDFKNEIIRLTVSMQFDLNVLIKSLVFLGYEYEEPVRQPGTFSNRGGIVDVFPTGSTVPGRIEFFGDFIESIRTFDVDNQKSILEVSDLTIPLARLHIPQEIEGFVHKLQVLADKQLHTEIRDKIQLDIESFEALRTPNNILQYLPELVTENSSIIDYLDGCLFINEPLDIENEYNRFASDLDVILNDRYVKHEIPKRNFDDYIHKLETIMGFQNIITLSTLQTEKSWLPNAKSIELNISAIKSHFRQYDTLFNALSKWYSNNFQIICSTDQPRRAQETLSNYRIQFQDGRSYDKAGVLEIYSGNLSGGFVWEEKKLVVITDTELFGSSKIKIPQRRFREGVPLATIYDLNIGDYVVHIQFGIGIYKGMVTREIDGVSKEFLHIEYAVPDKLLVPTDQLDRVQKYLTVNDHQPKLHRITGSEWKRALRNAKKGAEEFARSLLQIYAKRSLVTRIPYGPDTPWQNEMEAAFSFVETASQLSAIQDIKKDLESPHPMDRLVCGDVGFGKTEVAIRAAFKVVQAGKQVAVLCPTTILCEQHYATFKERLAGYPVIIETLSRLRSLKSRSDILSGLMSGTIDIVIGTHALLQKGISYKNLGLLIIDEEQRFGVKHKEMIKQIRSFVDVLTLTATPIPRTLQMSLMNVRPMSIISDPPAGRLPVRTYVKPYNNEVIKEAMSREISRGGQVIYVYNRVDKISYIAEKLKLLLPKARFAIGHGQMLAHELESVMKAFFDHEIDVLVCTTIVENGIDNPNANTLIVDGADKMGLSQLYQLRGRVGRSDRQAYSYFTYRPEKRLAKNAIDRLKALQEFATLGSGYSLAFRDLQIRGAGEILGTKQHGLVQTVGFELFMQLISSAVSQLKRAFEDGGEHAARLSVIEPSIDVYQPLPTFELPISAYFPKYYITDESQRLYYYKKLMEARDTLSVKNIQIELLDRYGTLPEVAEFALIIMELRIMANRVGVDRIDARQGTIVVNLVKGADLPQHVFSMLQEKLHRLRMRRHRIEWQHSQDVLNEIRVFLEILRDFAKDKPTPQMAN